jgi:hypothetical protein
MQSDTDMIERASRTLKRFRVGAVCIAGLPLLFAFMNLIGGDRNHNSVGFTITSVTLLFLILWICHCTERFLKSIQPAEAANQKDGRGSEASL